MYVEQENSSSSNRLLAHIQFHLSISLALQFLRSFGMACSWHLTVTSRICVYVCVIRVFVYALCTRLHVVHQYNRAHGIQSCIYGLKSRDVNLYRIVKTSLTLNFVAIGRTFLRAHKPFFVFISRRSQTIILTLWPILPTKFEINNHKINTVRHYKVNGIWLVLEIKTILRLKHIELMELMHHYYEHAFIFAIAIEKKTKLFFIILLIHLNRHTDRE